MGARVTRRVVAASALAGLAVLVLLLAADVRSWGAAMASGDAAYAASPARASWQPATKLGGLATDILGVDDDLVLRRALRLYAVARATHLRLDNATQVQTARAAAQDALLEAAASSDAKRASEARTLLGVLTFGSSASGAEQDQVDSAIADFADAIRADPANDEAKFDLELLLRLSAAHGTRPGQGLGGATGRGGNRRGAGGGSPGRGY
jgi:hypothetical protein